MNTALSSLARRSLVRSAAGVAALGLLGFGLTAPVQAMTAPYSTPQNTTTTDPADDPGEDADGPRDIDDAVFEWSVNDESTGGSYFGGCNFLAAGEAGDSGMARIWTKDDAGKQFKTDESGNFTEGNVSIVKENDQYSTFATRCATADGNSVNNKTNAEAANNHTGDHVRIDNGAGKVDPETNSVTIQWEGSWTFAYYGGMTYWTITNPKLEVKDGKGVITGTYSGYGTDMDDMSKWEALKPVAGNIVEIQKGSVDVTEKGFTFLPDYLGVATDTAGRNPQDKKTAENESWWGAMPQDWIDFNVRTGQDSYWYTTAGAKTSIQPRKTANELTVTYDEPVDKPDDGDHPEPPGPAPKEPDDPGDDDGKDDDKKNAGGDGTATLYWSLNQEANGGAFYGGCNFLSAGKSKDSGSARVWPSGGGGFYKSNSGNVTIQKPTGSTFREASWDSRCLDATGETVSTSRKGSWTQSRVAIKDGEVSETDSGVTVQWKGSFTVAFYGGMTYWSATDPKLEVDSNGKSTLVADLSGYGADMFDSSKWITLEPESITMANFKNIDIDALLDDGHITATPDYLGLKYDNKGKEGSSGSSVGGADENASAQAEKNGENADIWGAFPQSFVDFQHKTGQYSYWFTSGGVRDPYKPAEPMTISLGDYEPGAGDYEAAAGSGTPGQGAGGSGGGQSGAGQGSGTGAGGSSGGSGRSADKADAKKDSEVDDETVFAQEAEEARAASEVPVRAWIAMGTGLAVAVVAGFGIRSGIRRSIGLDPTDLS
ncbi:MULTISPECIES: HtaA domain-containing protein [unclassified Brevibacterium]|uniref:HtaA domain-containing protein n=1 Tax=unclassified Brevibacterium TaxID=2614124 RepID=UPI001E5CAA9A|nr:MULTISPECIES: HtaA domain-containing protein [unclassified Brevibacterium]MDK8434707.1 HtaA domain-containing protein [Brevibacterium sp. H-BE7]